MKTNNKNQLGALAAEMANEEANADNNLTKAELIHEKKSDALRQRVNNARLRTVTLTLRADVLKELDEMRQDKYLLEKTRRHVIMEAIQEKIMRYQALRTSAKNRGTSYNTNNDKN